jgi:hypothetical protein
MARNATTKAPRNRDLEQPRRTGDTFQPDTPPERNQPERERTKPLPDEETYEREPSDQRRGPLDGSTSGTIGGGGPETGGPSERRVLPDPPVKPENAASGRLAPDVLGATAEHDVLRPGPTDVNNATAPSSAEEH